MMTIDYEESFKKFVDSIEDDTIKEFMQDVVKDHDDWIKFILNPLRSFIMEKIEDSDKEIMEKVFNVVKRNLRDKMLEIIITTCDAVRINVDLSEISGKLVRELKNELDNIDDKKEKDRLIDVIVHFHFEELGWMIV